MPSVDIPSTEPTGRYLPMTGVAAVNDIEALSTADSDGQYLYVEEFDATYRWDAESDDEIDNVRVLGVEDEPGRWIIVGREVSIRPFGGVANDWERMMLVCAAMAYFGKVNAAGETWNVKTNEVTPSGTFLEFMPGADLAVDLTPLSIGGAFAASAFWNDGGTGVSATTTLAQDAAIGSLTIVVASAADLAVGDLLNLRHGSAWVRARAVVAIAGTTVTLDEPLLRPHYTGDGVAVVDGTRDVTILGNGLRITGTGDAAFELISSWRCRVEDVHVYGQDWGIYQFAYDVAARDCWWIRCTADGQGVTPGGFASDFAERVHMVDCNAKGCTHANVSHCSTDDCSVTRGFISEQVVGDASACGWLVSIVNVADTIGSKGLVGDKVNVSKCAGPGILAQNGAQLTLIAPDVAACQIGVSAGGGTAGAAKVTILGGRVHDNGVYALYAQQSAAIKTYGTVRSGATDTATSGTIVEG